MVRKVGRPRKIYEPGERKVQFTCYVREKVIETIPKGADVGQDVDLFLDMRYGGRSQSENELIRMNEDEEELMTKLSSLRARKELIQIRVERERAEKAMIEFQRRAVSHHLITMITGMSRAGNYDVDYEVEELAHSFGLIIPKASLISAIRNPDQLKEETVMADLNVKFSLNYQVKRYWSSMLEDYQKFLDSRKGEVKHE